MIKISNILLTLLTIMWISFGGLMIFWLVWPYDPIEIHNLRSITKQVKAGENYVYEASITKKLPVSATITRQIVNGVIINTEAFQSNTDVGVAKVVNYLPVPKYVDCGDGYRMRWKAVYQVNPIRAITVTAMSEPFSVVKSDCGGN